jgi:hypothetical protein
MLEALEQLNDYNELSEPFPCCCGISKLARMLAVVVGRRA